MISLPDPDLTGGASLDSVIMKRRSTRSFIPKSPSLADIARIMWSGQGITDNRGYRTAPSAGALYPLEIYLVAGTMDDLASGVYRYVTEEHGLMMINNGDLRSRLSIAALGQQSIARAPLSLVITAVYQRTALKYGKRAGRYVHIEAGHAGQNILLQATARGLGTVIIGAFEERAVRESLGLPDDHEPVVIIPAGFPATDSTG